jgi:hypothetical protein
MFQSRYEQAQNVPPFSITVGTSFVRKDTIRRLCGCGPVRTFDDDGYPRAMKATTSCFIGFATIFLFQQKEKLTMKLAGSFLLLALSAVSSAYTFTAKNAFVGRSLSTHSR